LIFDKNSEYYITGDDNKINNAFRTNYKKKKIKLNEKG